MTPGDTFVPIAPRGDGHLWVVISAPTPQNRLAIVNLTTRRPPCDDSCILQARDHPFLRHESIVFYARARLADADILDGNLSGGLYSPRDPVTVGLLRRIQDGALVSPYTSGLVQACVRSTLRL